MRTTELRRKLKDLAGARGVGFAFDAAAGKGSHGRVWFGDLYTTMPTHGEVGRGLLHKILRDLGLSERDLR